MATRFIFRKSSKQHHRKSIFLLVMAGARLAPSFPMNYGWQGVSNTHLNTVSSNSNGMINGLGLNHIHNEIAQYLTAGGIVFVALYIIMWGICFMVCTKKKICNRHFNNALCSIHSVVYFHRRYYIVPCDVWCCCVKQRHHC